MVDEGALVGTLNHLQLALVLNAHRFDDLERAFGEERIGGAIRSQLR